MTAAAITFVRQSRGTEVTVHDRGWHQARRVSRHTGIAESTAAGRWSSWAEIPAMGG